MATGTPQSGKRVPKGSSSNVVVGAATSSTSAASRSRSTASSAKRPQAGASRSQRRGLFFKKDDTGTTAGIPNKELMRPGIVPGIAGVVAMFIGMATYQSDWYITVLFLICILAAILAVMSFQAVELWKRIVFTVLFAVIAVYWNPIYRFNEGFNSGGQVWLLVQLVAAAIFFLGGFLLKTRAAKR